jgi:predicted cupin superfamily sugar epimerase
MKPLRMVVMVVLLAGLGVGLSVRAQAVAVDGEARAEQIIKDLDMRVLPKESGYWGVIGRTAPMQAIAGRTLAAQSETYELLTAKLPVRFLNKAQPVETDVLIEGGPVDVYSFCPDGHVDLSTLGLDFAKDEQGVVVVPAACWKALVLRPGAKFALMADLLAPEYTSDRVTAGAGPEFVRRYAGKAEWATAEFLRKLIGPNWMP